MTCIVGIIDKEKVIMGADSAGVYGLDVIVRKDPKIFKTGDFLIGCTSSFRMIELLQFSLKVKPRKDKGIYEYMCTDFINGVRKCFKKGGYLQKFKGGDDQGGTFLVGYKGRLFSVEGDFQVAESTDDFLSVGCGSPFAYGSLCTTRGMKLKPKERILKALEIAAERSGGVRPPFKILEN